MLHPQCKAVVRWIEEQSAAGDDVASLRELERRRVDMFCTNRTAVAEIRELTVRGADRPLPARYYRPLQDSGDGIVLWLHGGGFITGSPDTCDDEARVLAVASQCPVVSIDYRLAPEHPFPAAVEDCYAALTWLAENVVDEGIRRAGWLAVGGDSAGGNLAAAVTLLCRDQDGPRIDCQLLVYPVLAMEIQTPSRSEFGSGYGLDLRQKDRSPAYLQSQADSLNPLASPLLAESLADLPPAVILTAEFDPLRDEAEAYAERLEQAGVPVELRRYDGMIHGFWAYGNSIEVGPESIRWAGEQLRLNRASSRSTSVPSRRT